MSIDIKEEIEELKRHFVERGSFGFAYSDRSIKALEQQQKEVERLENKCNDLTNRLIKLSNKED